MQIIEELYNTVGKFDLTQRELSNLQRIYTLYVEISYIPGYKENNTISKKTHKRFYN